MDDALFKFSCGNCWWIISKIIHQKRTLHSPLHLLKCEPKDHCHIQGPQMTVVSVFSDHYLVHVPTIATEKK